jgi:ABC-type amino acid transport substrate-binding protein
MKRYKSQIKLSESGKSYKLINQEGYFQKVYPHIKAINQIIGYDIDLMRSICVHLLQEVNDHDMSAKLDMLFSRDI